MLATEIQQAIQDVTESLVAQRSYATYEGEHAHRLQKNLAETLGFDCCLLTSSGSCAVEIALRACGVGQGDEVLLSGYDYPGNFWAIERVGARPVLIDTLPDSWAINENLLETVLDASPTCKAAIVSHLHGQLQNTKALQAKFAARDIRLVEDCCQSVGARQAYDSRDRVGISSDFCIVSFGGSKVLSAGRGGALLTNSESLAQKAKLAAGAGSGPYGLSEIQAALVTAQLPFLDRINQQTRQFFAEMQSVLGALAVDERNAAADPPECVDWLIPVDLQDAKSAPGIYQYGVVLHGTPNRDDSGEFGTEDISIDRGLERFGIGSGFSGFHRRSKRRCNIPRTLEQTAEIARRTFVIHHRVALGEQIAASDLAQELWRITSSLRKPTKS